MGRLNRRDTLKLIALSPVAAAGAVSLAGCAEEGETDHVHDHGAHGPAAEAVLRDGRLHVPPMFFTQHEYATLTRLVDFIVPADGRSGSASEAEVPAYIDFTALDRDEPEELQVGLRGGLAWIDYQCVRRCGAAFVACEEAQCRELLDLIAFPEDVEPGMEPGAAFFTVVRDLTASGFYSSETGIQDIRYVGNKALASWDGVPQDVLGRVGVSYADWENATG